MTPATLTLLGLGLGALLVVGGRSSPRAAMTTRERAIMAQQTAARAAQLARELAVQWSTEQSRALPKDKARDHQSEDLIQKTRLA